MVHGYLLRGTGSNLFVSNLARSFCKKGHDVFLFCQERQAKDIDFISEHNVLDEDNKLTKVLFKREIKFSGRCRLYNPNLHGLLPVYVYDEYKGFKVKVFHELEDSELEDYIDFNRQAIEAIHKKFNFDVIQSNHVIMSPYIARMVWSKHKVPYYITLHGSALNFTVKSDPKRFNPYAEESLLDAEKIFAVSEHNRAEMLSHFPDIASEVESKVKVVPSGVDAEIFKTLKGTKTELINNLCSILEEKIKKWPKGKTPKQKSEFTKALSSVPLDQIGSLVDKYNNQYNPGYPDTDIVETLKRIDWERDKIILFVGKYLPTKGIQIIVDALPLVIKEFPNLHALLVGFGKYREELEALVFSLQNSLESVFSFIQDYRLRRTTCIDSV